MQLKLMYQGKEVKCEEHPECQEKFCRRELLMKVILSFVRPQIVPIINRIFEIQELFQLADIVSQGENQLRHVIRICEYAERMRDKELHELGINRDTLLTAVLFHDVGKGPEVDDRNWDAGEGKPVKVPALLARYGLPSWADYREPQHYHLVRGLQIARTYNLSPDVMEAVALHHHVKITPEVLDVVSHSLGLAPAIKEDIRHFQPEQYAVRGSKLAQVVAILDQLCAIERKFSVTPCLWTDATKIEDELVKDLVIGVALTDDPRFRLLGVEIKGDETVILLDLCSFGTFVRLHSEYEVQALKRTVLNTIRSVVRAQNREGQRERDLVGLVGGDEFVVLTKVRDPAVVEKMISRICGAVKAKTGFDFRYGYGIGEKIPDNFHTARQAANLKKRIKFLGEK